MKKLTIFAVSTFLFASCGLNNITEDEATEGWTVASAPLAEGQEKLQEKATENVSKLLGGETISHTVHCDEAGRLKFTLKATFDSDAGMSSEPKVDLKANYNDCEDNQVVVNGHLTIDSPQFSNFMPGGGSGDGDTEGPTVVTYIGHLDYTKDVDGPCDVNMDAEIPASGGRPTYSGRLCGYDAGDLLNTAF